MTTYNIDEQLENLFVDGKMESTPRRYLVVTSNNQNVWCDSILVPGSSECDGCNDDECDDRIGNDASHDRFPIAIIEKADGKNVFVTLFNVVTIYDFAPEDDEACEDAEGTNHTNHTHLEDPRMYT
jgi:hypothetical protein